jgi:hypothetical protein
MNPNPSTLNQILGGQESHVVVGVAAYTIPAGLRGFALTVRTQGTIIAAMTVQTEAGLAAVAYVPTWLAIALNQGDYFVSKFPIVSITLTAATDSVTLHCTKPF